MINQWVKSMLGKFGSNHNRSIQIDMLNSEGQIINQFGSAKEAERTTGISQGQISRVVRGERKQTRGFIFKIHEATKKEAEEAKLLFVK